MRAVTPPTTVCATCGDWSQLPRAQRLPRSCGCPQLLSDSGFFEFRPKGEALSDAYRALYDSIAMADLDTAIQDQESLNAKAEMDLKNMGKITSDLRVLEIGPASGTLTRKLIEAGATVTCADLTDVYWKTAAFPTDRVTCVLADAQDLPFRSTFDLVVLTDVLEHVFRPADVLISISRALVPNGKLYVRSPSNEALAPYGLLRGCPYPAVHLRSYDRGSLRRELVAAGFHCGRRVKYLRHARWMFPSALAVRIRDRMLSRRSTRHAQPKTLRRTASLLYQASTRAPGRWILTTPLEVWALASAVGEVDPLAFNGTDVNYVGLIDRLHGGTSQ